MVEYFVKIGGLMKHVRRANYLCRVTRTKKFCPSCQGRKGGCEDCDFTGKVSYLPEEKSNEDTPNE